MPQIATAEPRGLRLAWLYERTGVQHVVRAENGRRHELGPAGPASNLISGAPFKSPDGCTFTHDDYPGQAVNSLGTAFAIGGEADVSLI